MGASESKVAVETPKPDRSLSRQIKNDRISRLIDPRSPSTEIDRTPIQVGDAAARASECEGAGLACDPRSPSLGISRTPMKDVMRATVHSFARRLGMLFLNEGGDRVAPLPPVKFSEVQNLSLEEEGEMDTVEPLLPLQPSLDSATLSPGVCVLPAPACPVDQASDCEAVSTHSSGCQAEGEDERQEGGEVDDVLDSEGATTDDDLPLNKELSLSLIACHDGDVSSQASDVSDDAPRPLSPLPDIDPCGYLDSEASPSPTPSPAPDSVPPSSAEASPATSPVCGDAAEPQSDTADTPAKAETDAEESPEPAAADPAPSHAQAGLDQIGLKLPTFSSKSPSQVVFKPQWLGVGFGVTGLRARGVQGKAKGSSSPLSVRVGGRNAGNENRGPVARPKQRERCGQPLANEGRSPLLILKETNSPLEHASQMKLKISTPDRQRLGQVDRRALTLSLNKENQR